MVRTGTGMSAGNGTEAGVLEDDTTPIVQNNNENDCYKLPPRDQTTGSTARSRASGAQDSAGARAQRSSESSRGTLPAQALTSAGTRSAGLGKADEAARLEAVMALLNHITKTELRATFKHSFLGAAVASPFIIGGALLFGPVGIFIGGTVGGVIAWAISEDYKSVPQVLMELPAAEKQKLCAEAMAVVEDLKWTDAAQLIALVTSNSALTEKVLGVLTTYLSRELKVQQTSTE